MSKDEIILEALIQYEENNWESEDDEWQQKVNKLISEYKEKANAND